MQDGNVRFLMGNKNEFMPPRVDDDLVLTDEEFIEYNTQGLEGEFDYEQTLKLDNSFDKEDRRRLAVKINQK